LFAVVVLGIGFIMVAAIFPVAISQSKATADEVAAAGIARSGASVMTDLVNDPRDPAALTPPLANLPRIFANTVAPYDPGATGVDGDTNEAAEGDVMPVMTLGGWRAIRGNMIFRDDPRYAFVPLYRRGNTAGLAIASAKGTMQIYIIGVQCRSTSRANPSRADAMFDLTDVGVATTPNQPNPTIDESDNLLTQNPNNLRPRRIRIQLENDTTGAGADLLKVNDQPNSTNLATENLPDALAEGTYVITSATGRIYRLGVRRPDLDANQHLAWELQPGNDLVTNAENETADVTAWCVGRERQPSDGSFIGGAQDISIYTAIIPVKP
jgi:hypothetical protein